MKLTRYADKECFEKLTRDMSHPDMDQDLPWDLVFLRRLPMHRTQLQPYKIEMKLTRQHKLPFFARLTSKIMLVMSAVKRVLAQ